MSIASNKFVYTGLFFLVIFITGFWLSRRGAPYGALLFNLHKLIALAAGFILAMNVYRSHQAAPLTPLQLALVAATTLVFVALIVAGGLLSAHAGGSLRGISPALLAAITQAHHLLPYLAALGAATTLTL